METKNGRKNFKRRARYDSTGFKTFKRDEFEIVCERVLQHQRKDKKNLEKKCRKNLMTYDFSTER